MTANFQKFRVILLVVFITMAVLVFALPAGAATIDISVNGSIRNWVLTPGSTNENSTAVTLNVSCDGSSWTVSVMDNLDDGKNSTSAGRMLEYNATTNNWIDTGSILKANLTVEGGTAVNVTGSQVTLGPIDQVIGTGYGTVDKTRIPVTISQHISPTDIHLTNGDVYRAVITFVGVAS